MSHLEMWACLKLSGRYRLVFCLSIYLCILTCSYFLIYKISSILTHFPRRTLGLFFLECETTSIMLPKQSVAGTKSLDSERKHLSLIISHFFVGRLILWCEFMGTLSLPRDQQNQLPINRWMEEIQIHGTDEAAATLCRFLFYLSSYSF